ncbi:MAG: AAA family ATPase [Oligoflexia bacterium]|nr:AAA family ATPase [Oligoflexia bacterium]
MPHQRPRFAEERLRKLASFWPVIGLLGLRQVGKSTLLRDRLGIGNYLTLDDDDLRSEANASPGTFLGPHAGSPTVIDEVQKAPALFDAIKANVDRRKIPGQWYLSGSVAFSQKIGIRESLTGRIGLLHLFPMTIAEVNQLSPPRYRDERDQFHGRALRVRSEEVAAQMKAGGLPVPAFVRDPKVRTEYWNNWLDTTIARDAAKAYGRGFDMEYCSALLRMLARALPDGEYPSLAYVIGDKRKAKRYLEALESIFLLRRMTVHELGAGNDHWLFGDSGLAFHLSPEKQGLNVSLSIARHYLLNEIFCLNEYSGHPLPKLYYKSARGSVIDLVWNGIPLKIINESIAPSQMGYHKRAVEGAMGTLGAKRGILLAPVNQAHLPKKGVCLLPWGFWS